jgi:hypothetical protein
MKFLDPHKYHYLYVSKAGNYQGEVTYNLYFYAQIFTRKMTILKKQGTH